MDSKRIENASRPKTCAHSNQNNSTATVSSPDIPPTGELGFRRNSEAIRRLTAPTLSSLNKIKPIAVIKAYDEVADQKTLLEKSKVLEKLRSTHIRSPLLDQRREELEEIFRIKSYEIIHNELSHIIDDARTLVMFLSARYGDCSYRLDLANSWSTMEQETRVKAIENFSSDCEERTRLVMEVSAKFRFWHETIDSSLKIQSANSCDPPLSDISLIISRATQMIELHKKSCLLWLSKIMTINSKITCIYFDSLSFETISSICYCIQQFERLCESSDSRKLVPNLFEALAEHLCRVVAQELKWLFPNVSQAPVKPDTIIRKSQLVIFDGQSLPNAEIGNDSETGCDHQITFSNILEVNIMNCQRNVLRLIYAHYSYESPKDKSKKKNAGRKKWKLSPIIESPDMSSGEYLYQNADLTFWKTFWVNFESEIVNVFVMQPISTWKKVLDQVSDACKTSDELSPAAVSVLSSAYERLIRLLCEHEWSVHHRKMLQAMEVVDPDTQMNASGTRTLIGSSVLAAVEPVVTLVKRCGADDECIHSLTLTINTFINWIDCEDFTLWPLMPTVVLIWSDLQTFIEQTKSMCDETDSSLQHDLLRVQESNIEKTLQRLTIKGRELIKERLPRSNYRSRDCTPNLMWLVNCFEETDGEIIEKLNFLSQQETASLMSRSFLTACLQEFIEEPVRFSTSGARAFAMETDALFDRLKQITDSDERDLPAEQSHHFLRFCRLVTSESSAPLFSCSIIKTCEAAPIDAITFRRRRHISDCLHCCYF